MTAQELKNSILMRAVQGKLVPQDPNDEPASVLLEKIRAEKEQLMKEKIIKKQPISIIYKDPSDNQHYEKIGKDVKCIEDEIPFEIPESWEWARLGTIFSMQAGKNIQASNIFEDTSESHPYLCYGGNGIRGYVSDFNREGSFPLIGRQGALCGNIKHASGKFYATEHAVVVSTYSDTNIRWACLFLEALKLNQYATATAQPGLAVSKILTVLIPVPPCNEQYRIIERIDSFTGTLAEYESANMQLDNLNNKINAEIKKSILQYAIQGKLVPQDPNDEPASVLLDCIRAEKEQLIKDGKIKRDKNESYIYRGSDNSYYEKFIDGREVCIDDELPFEIPNSWCWCRFGNYVINRDSERKPLSSSSRESLEKNYDYYGASGIIDKVDTFLFNTRLLLIGEDGANLLTRSKPIAFFAEGEYWVNNHAHVLDATKSGNLDFVALYINSISLAKYVTGTAQPKMNQEKMNSILMAIPPYNEQKRICSKVSHMNLIIK